MIVSKLYRKASIPDGFGVEVEVEIRGSGEFQDVPGWLTEFDGSLSGNSREYILRGVSPYPTVKENINTLYNYLDTLPLIISGNAGIHVHINVLNWDIEEVWAFVYLFYLLEDVLLPWCGEKRIGNIFCLSSKESEYQINILQSWIGSGSLQRGFKYSALNLQCITTLGSVEARCLELSKDRGRLLDWVDILQAMVEFVKEHKTIGGIDAAKKAGTPVSKDIPILSSCGTREGYIRTLPILEAWENRCGVS